jgi:hypothetical protein
MGERFPSSQEAINARHNLEKFAESANVDYPLDAIGMFL